MNGVRIGKGSARSYVGGVLGGGALCMWRTYYDTLGMELQTFGGG